MKACTEGLYWSSWPIVVHSEVCRCTSTLSMENAVKTLKELLPSRTNALASSVNWIIGDGDLKSDIGGERRCPGTL